MLSVFFASICFVAMINKIQGQTNKYPQNLNLILINGTSPLCEINQTEKEINVCVNLQHNYQCSRGDDNNNISLTCTSINNNSECHNVFISDDNNYNITLDCLYSTLNMSNGVNQLTVNGSDQCLYGIYYGSVNVSNSSNNLLTCTVWTPPIIVTTFNNTKIFEEGTKYYKFPLFGFQVSKHFVKSYGIIILVAIIVVSCLVAFCCCGLCTLGMRSMKNRNKNGNRNKSNSNSNSNDNYDNNRKMPQSAGYNI